jgi:DNA repair photolyase
LLCSLFVLYRSCKVDILPDRKIKGRGAISNRTGRFERTERVAVDDGWQSPEELPPKLRTTLSIDRARSVITYNDSPDVGFDRSVNPYRGCEHGCVYCFARPTHAWLGLSPGLDFETRLFYKPDAPERLAEELRHPKYRPAALAIGTNADPYQPIERECRLTRKVLEVLAEFRHPFGIVTKSALVTCDLDIIGPIAASGLASVTVTLTTLDGGLSRRLEPRAPQPNLRLAAIEALREAGVPVSVLFAPVIPTLNDWELDRVLEAAAAAGADGAGYVPLRLPREIKQLFIEWLETHVPDKASHVLSLIRQTRGGILYESTFGERMHGSGPVAQLLEQRFRACCRRLGMNRRSLALETGKFQPPPMAGDQLRLF